MACGSLVACGADETTGERWRGSVDEEGGVTVVRTESGSVWGGPATLEPLFTVDSAGHGPPMGDFRAIAADSGRIYVVDVQAAAVNVYDSTGAYLQTVGREGSGPGEFRRPLDLAVAPEHRRVFVRDAALRRVTVLRRDGSVVSTWNTPSVPGLRRPMVVTDVGALYLPTRLNPGAPPAEWRYGMVRFDVDGPTQDTVAAPTPECPTREVTFAGTTRGAISLPVPFSPEAVWTYTPRKETVWGCSDRYRITVEGPDGRRVIERAGWTPAPLDPEEAAWYRGMLTARIRLDDADWTWNGPDIPANKPAFEAFFTDSDGLLWIVRPGPGRRLADGLQQPEDPLDYFHKPAWEDSHILDAFDPEGRFLGRVELPPDVRVEPRPSIDGNRLIALVELPTGEPVVRAYRLRTP